MNKHQVNICWAIAQRMYAFQVNQGYDVPISDFRIACELMLVHTNICELRLREMSLASDASLCHDVFGIDSYIDTTNWSFRDCFMPRYAKSKRSKRTYAVRCKYISDDHITVEVIALQDNMFAEGCTFDNIEEARAYAELKGEEYGVTVPSM